MPKFLDDIKFIDSQGDEHNVSEYNNQIRVQGGFYTGDSHLEEFNEIIPELTIPQGEISIQGKSFTGLNANEENNVENSDKISDGKISIQGDYFTGLNAVGEDLSGISEGEISKQGDYYTGLNAVGEDLSGVPQGKISIQGSYFTGLDAGDESAIDQETGDWDSDKAKNGEIYKQGSKWKNDIISTGESKKQEVITAGENAIEEINRVGKDWEETLGSRIPVLTQSQVDLLF